MKNILNIKHFFIHLLVVHFIKVASNNSSILGFTGNKMKYKLILALLIFLQTTTYAQQEWSLQDCIEYAIKHNPDILSNKINLKIDSLHLQNYRLEQLPQVNFSINQGYQLGNTYNVSTGVGQKQSSYTGFNLSAQMTLFNGFLQKKQIRHKRKLQQKDIYLLEDAKWQLKWNIINIYYQILYEQENLSNIKYLINIQTEQIKIINQLHQQHYKPLEEVISAQIDLKNLQLQLQKSRQQVEKYTRKLTELIYAGQINIKLKPRLELLKTIPDTSNIRIENQPHLSVLYQEIKLLEIEKKIEKSKMYPQIFFNYSLGSNYYHILGQKDLIYNQQTGNLEPNGMWTQFKNNRFQYLGIGINIPIFNGLKIKKRIKELDYKKQIAKNIYQSEKHKTKGIYKQLLNDIYFSANQYNIKKEIFDLTKKNYFLKKEKYLKNTIPYAEWQQTNSNYHQALTQVLQAKYILLLKQELYIQLYKNY